MLLLCQQLWCADQIKLQRRTAFGVVLAAGDLNQATTAIFPAITLAVIPHAITVNQIGYLWLVGHLLTIDTPQHFTLIRRQAFTKSFL